MRLSSALLLVALAHAAHAAPPAPPAEQHYFDWTTLPFTPAELAQRRAALGNTLMQHGGGIFLTPGEVGRSGGETFRQRSDFYYFTGLELPDAVLAIEAPSGRATLFVPQRDARFDDPGRRNDFPGRPLIDDVALQARSGATLLPIEQLEHWLGEHLATAAPLQLDLGGHLDAAVTPPQLLPVQRISPEQHLLTYLRAHVPAAELRNAYAAVAALRMIKSPAEIALLRRAATLTSEAIRAAAHEVHAGVSERTLEAAFEAACKRGGAQRPAFASIIKSGPNSLWPWRILAAHYDRRNRTLAPGELVILDVGCELDHYTSDVGRTLPVSGRFTDAQTRLLRMELTVADAMIAAIRPGVTLAQVQAQGVAQIPPWARPYMQAAGYFGHHIGLEPGDPALVDAPLMPGMVLTVEPWFYDHDHGVAVFTEDVVLVTETGAELLTQTLPRTPETLEAMLRVPRAAQLRTSVRSRPPSPRHERRR